MFAAKDRPPQGTTVSSGPAGLAAPARVNNNLPRESQMPPFPLHRSKPLAKASVFNRLRTLLAARKLQHLYFHASPHSLKNGQNITPAFPITPALSPRSCAQEKESTPLFSCAHALFGKTTGGRGEGRKSQVGRKPAPLYLNHEEDDPNASGAKCCLPPETGDGRAEPWKNGHAGRVSIPLSHGIFLAGCFHGAQDAEA
jgi:hypothetical protein